ncbi:uncharacterized protein PADG_03654 [Paracoccidioides brasiliensis Pb18]|uniref:DNA damage-responsive protein 48 n=1 Tax=Paracoccidioides brasiliensis (strain Pb18) TaxID=502780 RepID=C1G8R8_PARBD|nr:uncharacterized protein PADG_03654 [Paracoccidioides brasiliensis Pb18]EEH47570.1 hypothetical protein PADG_03654 [Paracoccidioides brasiliensis Pb18]ODH48525.1 hypothetical protein GX48_05396 [Paracoccidioides brasiliensis]
MDFVNKFTGREQQQQQPPKESLSDKKEGGGFFSGIGDRMNTAAGGGKESEKNEDMLDKGIDFVQEHILGQGPQNNESALEQAKDEKISDFIRGQYKSTTGKELPIRDKETRFG